MIVREWWGLARAARAAARERLEAMERRRRVLRAVAELLDLDRYDMAARLLQDEQRGREAARHTTGGARG